MSSDVDEIFDFENYLLVIIIFEIIWTNTHTYINPIFFVLHVSYYIIIVKSLRSLRVTKLRFVTKLFSHYINRYILKLKSDDLSMDEGADFDVEEEVNKFIIE